MGWTEYPARHHKNGKVDRKAECDYLINREDLTVLRSSMVGSTYYAAVKNNCGAVFAVVILTSTNAKSYYDFAYKDMDETCGPHERKCPKAILDLLTDTESEWAREWREDCRKYHEARKSKPELGDLLPGSVIEFTANGRKYTATKVYGCAHIRRENGVEKVVKLDTRWALEGLPYMKASSRCINSWGYTVKHTATKSEAQELREQRVRNALLHTYP